MLHHRFSSVPLPPAAGGRDVGGAWQRGWLGAAASLLRFLYFKLVHVPQDGDLPDVRPARAGGNSSSGRGHLSGTTGLMRRHHEFLFSQTVGAFVASGAYELEMTENSVYFSEAFAFSAFCRLHGVDLVLESGVYKGASTELWSLFAKDVVAVDIFVQPEASARLAPRRNVRLLGGDGRVLLPRVLDEQRGRRAAVFIDGPKGELAIRLALALLREHPQVAFVALHDMGPYREELLALGAFFFSDEAWFQAAYGHLDAPFHSRPDVSGGGTMAFLPSPAA